jgi:hypothetical protein
VPAEWARCTAPGEPEKALDRLEPLLRMPYILSPAWLEIDPNFDPLRRMPGFRKLKAGRGVSVGG